MCLSSAFFIFLFFTDPAPPEIYTLSLHDALPISPAPWAPSRTSPALPSPPRGGGPGAGASGNAPWPAVGRRRSSSLQDRKSTRLNSSHTVISYAVFCLKKKKKKTNTHIY